MNWYKTLNVHQRINVKSVFELDCGLKFEDLSFLFSFKERIEILHSKLSLEGII